MKLKVFAFALLVTVKGYGQTKLMIEDVRNAERYEVLKSNKNVREGEYTRFTGPNFLSPIIEGHYHDNLRDSLWKYYSGKNVVAEGNYKAGEKVGVWTGYTRGFERLKYDFTNKKLLLYIPASVDSALQFKATNSETVVLERQPIYFNGLKTLGSFLNRYIRYPAAAYEVGKQGELIVRFIVDEKGRANYSLKNKLGYGIDDEVVRVLGAIEGDWVPGTVNGKAVDVEGEFSIMFEINMPDNTPHKPNQIVIIRAMSETSIRKVN